MIECQWCGSAIEPGEQVTRHYDAFVPDRTMPYETRVTAPRCIECSEATTRRVIRLEAAGHQP